MADRLVGHHALSFSIYFYLYIGGDGVSLVIYMDIHADLCDAKSHQLLPCQRPGPLTRVSIIHMFNNCYYSVDQHHTQRQTDRLKKLRIQKMGNLFCPLFVVRAKPAAKGAVIPDAWHLVQGTFLSPNGSISNITGSYFGYPGLVSFRVFQFQNI